VSLLAGLKSSQHFNLNRASLAPIYTEARAALGMSITIASPDPPLVELASFRA
jgi:hypothetical protein